MYKLVKLFIFFMTLLQISNAALATSFTIEPLSETAKQQMIEKKSGTKGALWLWLG
ncbi:MAG: hypothetical protein LBH67_02510 [Rickettsia sp.]|jgi:uncharacterized iron-regulated protein|nr:hypothetical protein [Rickettsia sp.]